MLAVRLLGARRLLVLAAVAAASTLVFLASAGLLLGSYSALNWVLGGGHVLSQSGSRTVFSSRLPVSLADALRELGYDAEPQVLVLTEYGGRILLVRGVETAFSSRLSGAEALVGCRAAGRLGVSKGSAIPLASPTRKQVVWVRVAGVYCTGSLLDDEVLAPISVARRLAGLPEGLASVVVVKSGDVAELRRILSSKTVVEVRLPEQLVGGWLLVADSRNAVTFYSRIKSSSVSLELPFGAYTVSARKGWLTISLGRVLASGGKVLLSASSGPHRLVVRSPGKPVVASGGQVYEPVSSAGGSWVFVLPAGFYTVKAGGKTFRVPLAGEAVLDAFQASGQAECLVSVRWGNGQPVRDFLLQVERNGVLVASLESRSGDVRLALKPGTYKVKVVKPPIIAGGVLRAPGRTTIALPWPSGKIPASRIASILPAKLSSPESSLSAVTGMSALALLSSLVSALALSFLAVLSASWAASRLLEDRFKALVSSGYSPLAASMLLLPGSSISYVAGWLVSNAAYWAAGSQIYRGLTVLGHSVLVQPLSAAAISLAVDAAGLLVLLFSASRRAANG